MRDWTNICFGPKAPSVIPLWQQFAQSLNLCERIMAIMRASCRLYFTQFRDCLLMQRLFYIRINRYTQLSVACSTKRRVSQFADCFVLKVFFLRLYAASVASSFGFGVREHCFRQGVHACAPAIVGCDAVTVWRHTRILQMTSCQVQIDR